MIGLEISILDAASSTALSLGAPNPSRHRCLPGFLPSFISLGARRFFSLIFFSRKKMDIFTEFSGEIVSRVVDSDPILYLYRVLLSFTEFYRVLPSFTEFYRVFE